MPDQPKTDDKPDLRSDDAKLRVDRSRTFGDYFRQISLFYNCHSADWPKVKPIDFDSFYGKNLMERAKKQFGQVVRNKDGLVKIRCRHCNKTYTVNEIDNHEIECPKNVN